MMEQFILLENMRFFAYHGVFEQEKQAGGWFEVSLKIKVEFTRAIETDDVNDTINYAEVYNTVAEKMNIPSNLLEHLAGRIINAIRQKFPEVKGIELALSKLNPPIYGEMEKATILLSVEN